MELEGLFLEDIVMCFVQLLPDDQEKEVRISHRAYDESTTKRIQVDSRKGIFPMPWTRGCVRHSSDRVFEYDQFSKLDKLKTIIVEDQRSGR